MTSEWQVAQINIATALYPADDGRMSGFYTQLDDVNALADNSAGFIWRLQSETGNATDILVGDDPLLIVNMSVWQSVEALFDFAYKSAHRNVVANRRKWFSRPAGAYQVLWWIRSGHRPSIEEGMSKLKLLQVSGPGPQAFTFNERFPPPGDSQIPRNLNPDPCCSGWE